MQPRVSAVFDTASQAEQAVDALRQQGIADEAIAVIARQPDGHVATENMPTGDANDADHDEDTAGKRAGKGALAGAGVGALFGIAAALIPGIGPFITAGWLASTLGALGGGAAAGAIVGGSAGAVAGALSKAGYSKDEAEYYGKSIEAGKYFVAIDTEKTRMSAEEIRATLARYGAQFGQSYGERAA